MSSDVLIRCEKVGKTFCRDLKKSLWYGVKDCAADLFGRRSPIAGAELRAGEFWANKDVSFDVKRGECLGLIGRNGAGKTTLLKMLNGLIKPDTGTIEIHGRVGALIALGAGFNPILTGRENVIVNATVLGLSKSQIKDQIDEIVDFAELREFIGTPVRNYSSGMQVRLGFAIATIIAPDVLILDEVLAVGDASFRHKCYSRINRLMRQSAVILVSHSMDYIAQLSSSVGLLERGEMTLYTNTNEGISAYNAQNQASASSDDNDGGKVTEFYPPVVNLAIHVPEQVNYGECLTAEIEIEMSEAVDNVILSFTAINQNEQPVMSWHAENLPTRIRLVAGRQTIAIQIDPILLHQGNYKWNFNAYRQGSIEHIVWYMRAGSFGVIRDGSPLGDIPYLPLVGKISHSLLDTDLRNKPVSSYPSK